MTNILNGRVRAAPAPAATETTNGQQLTELPVLDLTGKDLNDFATYARKVSSGGEQDFRLPLSSLMAGAGSSQQYPIVDNKAQMRTLTPTAAKERCDCLGGTTPFDNKGGKYITVASTDADNDGDRIRPNDFRGFVWYKW